MGLKDDFEQYKQRQEVKKYFRSQNDLYLNHSEWLKVILITLVVSILCGIILNIITSALHINIMYLYIVLGYVIAKTVYRVSDVQSEQMGILASVMTLVACFVSQIPFALLSVDTISALTIAFSSIISNLFMLLFVIVACIIAYSYAK